MAHITEHVFVRPNDTVEFFPDMSSILPLSEAVRAEQGITRTADVLSEDNLTLTQVYTCPSEEAFLIWESEMADSRASVGLLTHFSENGITATVTVIENT